MDNRRALLHEGGSHCKCHPQSVLCYYVAKPHFLPLCISGLVSLTVPQKTRWSAQGTVAHGRNHSSFLVDKHGAVSANKKASISLRHRRTHTSNVRRLHLLSLPSHQQLHLQFPNLKCVQNKAAARSGRLAPCLKLNKNSFATGGSDL